MTANNRSPNMWNPPVDARSEPVRCDCCGWNSWRLFSGEGDEVRLRCANPRCSGRRPVFRRWLPDEVRR